MTVFVYVNTAKQVGDVEHIKVFAKVEAAEIWFEENDPELRPSLVKPFHKGLPSLGFTIPHPAAHAIQFPDHQFTFAVSRSLSSFSARSCLSPVIGRKDHPSRLVEESSTPHGFNSHCNFQSGS
ncbi:hypothetical protein FXB40_41665 [Bradyrhizobium rifense]|uniref:Uncharacterized protein n=1 Tax=Bradyrhizobium rifense TaxID=515499 RepID=A0A5D3K2C5_9BRAD|nr:hypothetical protein [Bradyrhizobium rifense]TYL86691.1 hypothetical protein FXB40_41665 [Bradyrhizobium rifense]